MILADRLSSIALDARQQTKGHCPALPDRFMLPADLVLAPLGPDIEARSGAGYHTGEDTRVWAAATAS